MKERANFGSKLGIVLATAGGAVGLGNVWRFPYMAGQNGGAVFILLYFGSVLLLGIPCMVSEFIIGRHAASNTARAYTRLSGGSAWKLVGYLGVMTGFLISGYYAVVSGWCLQYVFSSLVGDIHGTPEYFSHYFSEFTSGVWKPILWLVLFLFLTHYVIIHGVRNGIERASKILMPILFVLLLVLVVSACLLPGAVNGIKFLFYPDFSKITPDVFLGALGQSFYSLSIAMGCICTYASYYTRQTKLLGSALQISLIDSFVAILAGLIIFPAAASVGIAPDSGPSLIFITIPNVFEHAFASMPVLGYVVSLLFFSLLALAALTSMISLHEVSTVFLQEEFRLTRDKAATIVTVACCVLGCLCSLSLGDREWLVFFGKSLFDIFDFVTGQIFLPIGGLLTCLFLGWVVPKRISKDEFTNWGTVSSAFFPLFMFLVRFVCPVAIAAIFLNQLEII